MAADRQSPEAIRQWLVRLGHLCFDDFLLLPPLTLDCEHWNPNMAYDWGLAVNNAPHIQRHFGFQPADLRLPEVTIENIRAAQARLVSAFAYDLLRAKAPPLYDALPWHDWDFSIVAKRFKLWQTRLVLAGDGTTVTMCRCRKSAGVYVIEPDKTIAGYTERKAAIERTRRFKLLRTGLNRIPLPDCSADLAVIGSVQEELTASALAELERVAANALLIENNPLAQPLPEDPLAAAGFKPDSVVVSGIGPRRCWWKRA
jgi:hypothetical protein